VGLADASGIEHGDDIGGHGGYGKQAGRPVAAPASAVVYQHKPEVAPQFPPHRLPPGPVEAHPLDQDQPRPPPVHSSAQFVGDPQLTAAGVPGPGHVVSWRQTTVKERPVRIASIC
jgi:hypothetical protein